MCGTRESDSGGDRQTVGKRRLVESALRIGAQPQRAPLTAQILGKRTTNRRPKRVRGAQTGCPVEPPAIVVEPARDMELAQDRPPPKRLFLRDTPPVSKNEVVTGVLLLASDETFRRPQDHRITTRAAPQTRHGTLHCLRVSPEKRRILSQPESIDHGTCVMWAHRSPALRTRDQCVRVLRTALDPPRG